jgi:hypothetical protein
MGLSIHEHHQNAADRGPLNGLPDESTLADAGFANQRQQPAGTCGHCIQELLDTGELMLTADERRVRRTRRAPGPASPSCYGPCLDWLVAALDRS